MRSCIVFVLKYDIKLNLFRFYFFNNFLTNGKVFKSSLSSYSLSFLSHFCVYDSFVVTIEIWCLLGRMPHIFNHNI